MARTRPTHTSPTATIDPFAARLLRMRAAGAARTELDGWAERHHADGIGFEDLQRALEGAAAELRRIRRAAERGLLRLVLIDVDRTLLASRAVVGRDYRGWEREIVRRPPPPVDGAVEGIAEVLRERDTYPIMVTARSARLRVATERSIAQHFPLLAERPMSMGDAGPSSGGTPHKLGRMLALAEAWPRASGVIVIDDDKAVCEAMPEHVEVRVAPGCWRPWARRQRRA
jgi:hypothetical protein